MYESVDTCEMECGSVENECTEDEEEGLHQPGVVLHTLMHLDVAGGIVGEAAQVHDQEAGQRVEQHPLSGLDRGATLLQLVVCKPWKGFWVEQ